MSIIELIPVTQVGVFGPVASGKTWLIKQWLATMTHALVIDVNWEFDDGSVDQVIEGSPKALAEAIQGTKSDEEDEQDNTGHRIAYVPRDIHKGFGWAVEAYWQLDMPRWLIIEEIHEYQSPWNKHPHMEKIMRYSRKRQIGVIGTSQRIASVHKDFCASCRMSVLFHTNEPADIKGIEERYGHEVSNAVLKLRPLLYRDATGRVEQTPQVLVHRRGQGCQVVDLGTGKTSTIVEKRLDKQSELQYDDPVSDQHQKTEQE